MPKPTKGGSALSRKLVKAKAKPPQAKKQPLWKGPHVDGVTQSLLSMFLGCRERFRLLTVEGLGRPEQFNHYIEYGSMFGVCKEVYGSSGNPIHSNPVATAPWEKALRSYAQGLAVKYRSQQEQVQHWYRVCKIQFPLYLKYWAKKEQRIKRQSLMTEEVFNVGYVLPSGRTVKLRGKWDGVDLVGAGKAAGVYLVEDKTKGDVIEASLRKQLTFDLQTMFYLVALQSWEQGEFSKPIKGIRYNVVRRPLSGGKHSIRRHKPSKSKPQGESADEYYARLEGLVAEEPEHYFYRWRVEVSPQDVEKFRQQCLDPILEQLCDWWEWASVLCKGKPFQGSSLHYRMPYGVYSPLMAGKGTDYDEYLDTGSQADLAPVDTLFRELQ